MLTLRPALASRRCECRHRDRHGRRRRTRRRLRTVDPAAVELGAAPGPRRPGGDRRQSQLRPVRRARRRRDRRQPHAGDVPAADRLEGVDRRRRRRRRRSWPRCRRGAESGCPRRGPPPRRQGGRPHVAAQARGGQPAVPAASGSSPATPTSTATRSDLRAEIRPASSGGSLCPQIPRPRAHACTGHSRGRRSSAAWRTCQSRSARARRSAASTSPARGWSGSRNGARASTARRRIGGLSVGRREDRIEAAVVADRTEGGDARLPHERIGGCCCRQLDQPVRRRRRRRPRARHTPRRRPRRRSRRDRPSAPSRSTAGWRAATVAARRRTTGSTSASAAATSSSVATPRRSRAPRAAARTPGSAERSPARAAAGVALVPGQGDAAPRRFDRSLSPSAGSSSS